MKYRKYDISLNDDGKIECRELDIVGDTVDDVKKAIRATETVQAAKPKIKILHNDSTFSFGVIHYTEGTTTGRVTSDKYERVWITYVNRKGQQKREKVSADFIVLDTPENREVISQIESLSQQNVDLESQISELRDKLKRL